MFLVVGLGNPDKEYQATRHNIGFMAADEIFRRYSFSEFRKKAQGLVAEGNIAGEKVLLVKPQTYMNLSGNCVGELVKFYKLSADKVIVIHDDMDLKIGDVREKIGGGSAGHNGIKSIDANVGRDYKRIRIGIGHPRDFDLPMEPADWVLGRFGAVQIAAINNVIDGINLF